MEHTTKWHSGQIDEATLEECYAELDRRYGRAVDAEAIGS
jgi:hypothetical protein